MWSSDGTAAVLEVEGLTGSLLASLGERLIVSNHEGLWAGTGRIGRWELLAAGPRVFFLAFDPDTGVELWAVE